MGELPKHRAQTPEIELAVETCRKCGKPIAASSDPLCCACRYGRKSWMDNSPREQDCYEHMRTDRAGRLASGFKRMRRDEE